MDTGLSGRRALVVGASRGLGKAIAKAVADEGAEVVLLGRRLESLQDVAADIGSRGGSAVPVVCDIANPEAINHALEQAGHVDILVTNCGGPPAGPILDMSDEAWMAFFGSMFLSTVRLTRGCIPMMRRQGWGRVLNIVSSGVIQPIPNLGASNALRAAVVGWSKTLAGEVAADGITVNCLAPGRIATDRVAELDEAAARREGISPEMVRARSQNSIPVKRYGTAEEFASVACFFVSQQASYVTGSVHRADGGSILSV